MALIIMSGVIISSMGLGTLIISSLQQTKEIDNGIVAYYAAESGVEDALYSVRRSDTLPAPVSVPQQLADSSWTRTVRTDESVLYAGTIPQDGLYEVALFDPQNSTAPQNISDVVVSWSDSCHDCTVMQASLVGWQSGSSVTWNQDAQNATVNKYPMPASGSVTIPLPDPNGLYRLRLTARNGDMQNVQISAIDSSGKPTPLPGRVRVDATGIYGGSNQKLTALFPRDAPLSGIFDFVVFSECSLVKGGASADCP
jgi:hypothetical protein